MIQAKTMDYSSEHGDSIDPHESVTLPRDQSIGDAAVDDDELESLRISLKKMAPDQTTKPKLQCVMMDPSFSMVTVQNENSGIVWEKAPNRCLSLWVSDASNISEAHSSPVCGSAGKIIFIMDEDKIRRRKKSGGKLDEELKRLSPRHADPEQLKGAEERPAVTPVSVLDVQPQGISEERELSGHKEQKERDVCSMVCEGSEELNIIFPSRLPSVEEEESCEKAEKLSYLEQAKMDTSEPMSEEKDSHVMNVSGEAKVKEEPCSTDKEPVQHDATHCPPVSKPVIKDEISDTDYLAKFALLDETPQPNLPKVEPMPTNANEEAKATENQDWSASSDPGIFTLSGDIACSHSENVSSGSRCHDEPDDPAGNENPTEEKDKHDRKEEVLKSPLMEGASAFFGSEEMILTPIVLPPGPSKIITPSFQEEPRATSFPYTELCEEAVGDQNKVEDCTDTESTVPERTRQQRQPDAEEASGYSEKCVLKDETPVVENETINGGIRMQPESTSELTGCKTGVKGKVDEENKITEQIMEDYSVQHEENCDTVTAKNTGLEEEMFQSPDVVQESKHFQKEAVTKHEKSDDKPGQKVMVEETGRKDKRSDTNTSKSLMQNMSENAESTGKEGSQHVPSSNAARPSETDLCTQKSPVLDEVSKQDVSQQVPGGLSESLLPHDVAVKVMDFIVKGDNATQSENSSPHEYNDVGKQTSAPKNTHDCTVCEEVQCAAESTTIHSPIADDDEISKAVQDKGEMISVSLLLPANTEKEKLEDDSGSERNGPSYPQVDLSEQCNDAYITEPPEMYRDQGEGNLGALAYSMINQIDACELLETEAVTEDKLGEQAEHGLDFMEEPTGNSPSKETDNNVNEVLNETPQENYEEESDSKMLRFRFCVVCRCIISSLDTLSEVHTGHDESTLDKAYADIKDKLSQWISVLQGKSEKIEDLVCELEQAYNLLENNCESKAQSLVEQHEEMVKSVVTQYDEMCRSMAEKKRLRLGQLESQIGTFQKRIQFAKETLERESMVVLKPVPFVFVSSSKDIYKSLCRALESLEPGQGNITIGTECCGETPLKDILVPQEPYLLVQEASSATCTSVTVFWRVSEEDVINCFQVNWVEEFQGDIPAVSEVSRLTVKESCCTLEELAPDRCYKVWVIAVNYAGCSLPSEKLPFRTAPSTPEIIPEQCTVCWDTAVIRWSSVFPAAVESFTLQYCRQNPCEGEGLRSISGIKDYAQRVFLQPNENYLFYISAVNFAGASGQSEAVLISTSGTKIHLLKDTASPGLVLCKDNTVQCPAEALSTSTELDECQTILAELLPPRGLHYWETTVEGSEGFRIGVAYHTTPRNTQLGENGTSWCIHCIPSSSSQQYKLLHSGSQTSVITAEVATRIGTLLDYNHGCLSFFNAQSGQLLGTCCHRFSEPCHPVLVLETPGTLALSPVVEIPDFLKRC